MLYSKKHNELWETTENCQHSDKAACIFCAELGNLARSILQSSTAHWVQGGTSREELLVPQTHHLHNTYFRDFIWIDHGSILHMEHIFIQK